MFLSEHYDLERLLNTIQRLDDEKALDSVTGQRFYESLSEELNR